MVKKQKNIYVREAETVSRNVRGSKPGEQGGASQSISARWVIRDDRASEESGVGSGDRQGQQVTDR